MGVPCGGIALKMHGKFGPEVLPPHPEHLDLRIRTINDPESGLFWKGEMLLRKIFDTYGSDAASENTLRHADFKMISEKRRENYQAILDGLKQDLSGIRVIFKELDEQTVPSHFVLFAEKRDELQAFLSERMIHSTVYWPVSPFVDLTGHDTAQYIYDHILAVPCDQRYASADMARIAEALNQFGGR